MSQIQIHEVTFERNTVTGEWRASCNCGWVFKGTQAECYQAGSTHDLDDLDELEDRKED